MPRSCRSRQWINAWFCLGVLLVTGIEGVRRAKRMVPQFIALPAPVEYFIEGGPELRLECRAWPTDSATIQFVIRRRLANAGGSSTDLPEGGGGSGSLISQALHPLPKGLGLVENGVLTVRDRSEVNQFSQMDLHCLASTEFGGVLSRPFRVVLAKTEDFPPVAGNIRTTTVEFIRGNVAMVDCYPPPSDPPAQVRFLFNDSYVKISEKFRLVYWPDGRRVSLLIHPFQPADQGRYRCTASNPKTMETKLSPDIVSLTINVPRATIPSRLRMHLAGSSGTTVGGGSQSQQIVVRQGSNVTLFCVMEGAPPPTVTTYNFNQDANKSDRYRPDSSLGLLHIMNVEPQDEGTYVCSDMSISSTAVLKVKRPLRLLQSPRDEKVSRLGDTVRFTCSSSDDRVTPQWYFNGKVKVTGRTDGSLIITGVTQSDLGVYQCIARGTDEWVAAQAVLSLKTDKLVTRGVPSDSREGDKKREQKRKNTRNDVQPDLQDPIPRPYLLPSPNALSVFDNLAVYLFWHQPTSAHSQDPGSEMDRLDTDTDHILLEYSVGQAGEDSQWGPPTKLNVQVKRRYFYLTSSHLQPGRKYRFRLQAIFTNGTSVYSGWSKEVSFEHIGRDSPAIDNAVGLMSGKMRVTWHYNGPVQMDRFLVLFRRVLGRDGTAPVRYRGYRKVEVNSSKVQAEISGLESGANYQVVVYGERGQGSDRRITRFSQEVYVPIPAAQEEGSSLWLSLLEGNRLMYIILGGLAGLMLVVMLVLITLCLWRQRRERRRRRQHNGFSYGYKDPAKSIHRGGAVGVGTVDHSMGPGGGGGAINPGVQGQAQQHHASNFMLANMGPSLAMTGGGPHHHHQSNQSLLMTTQMGGPPPLPPQPANQRLPTARHHYGSHQPINNMSGSLQRMETASLMADYYNQQYPQTLGYAGSAVGYHPSYPAGMQQSLLNTLQRQQQAAAGVGGYYGNGTLKREPPSGGSVHDASDEDGAAVQGETLYQRGGITGALSPQFHSIPYQQQQAVPAYLLSSQQHIYSQDAGQASLPAGYYRGSISHIPSPPPAPVHAQYQGGQGQLPPMYQHQAGAQYYHQQGYPSQAMMSQAQQAGNMRPSHLDVSPATAGGVGVYPHHHANDGSESVYSYFSQPEAGYTQYLNPLPEEQQQMQHQQQPGYAETGCQTVGGGSNHGNNGGSASGSPATGGHRHHRRRRRKLQGGAGGMMEGGAAPSLPPEMSATQCLELQPQPARPAGSQSGHDLHHHAVPGGQDQEMDHMQGQMQQQEMVGMCTGHGANVVGGDGGSVASTSDHYEPPSQYAGFESPQHHVQPPPMYRQSQQPPSALAQSMGSGGPGSAIDTFTRRQLLQAQQMQQQGQGGTPLFVGPPPRVRDYAEYGIPRGVVAMATTGEPQQHPASMGGGYREGQA